MQSWNERNVITLGFYVIRGSCNCFKPQWIYYRSIFLFFVVPFRPRFQADHLTPSLTGFSKRLTMCTNAFTHKQIELLAFSLSFNLRGAPFRCHGPSSAVFSLAQQPVGILSQVTLPYNEQHVRDGQLAVGIRPLDCKQLWKYCVWFLVFVKMHWLVGEVDTGVKWVSHQNWIINIMLSDLIYHTFDFF